MSSPRFSTQRARFKLLFDSGGPGRYRGGLGFVHGYRILQDEVRFSMRTDKHALAPKGSDGGRFGDVRLKTGDVLRVQTLAGGGV